MRATLLGKGLDVSIPKERLVMYRRNHGANLSDMRKTKSLWWSTKFMLKTLIKTPRASSSVRKEFGLYRAKNGQTANDQNQKIF